MSADLPDLDVDAVETCEPLTKGLAVPIDAELPQVLRATGADEPAMVAPLVPPLRPQPLLTRLSGHVLLVAVIVAATLLQSLNPAAPHWLPWPALRLGRDSQPAAMNAGGTGRNLLNVLAQPAPTPDDRLIRFALPLTTIPERGRRFVMTYTVQPGDTLFGIAYQFDLMPETILWSTPDLGGNPHMLSIGQIINIPPVDGVYHIVAITDTLQSIAEAYKVEPAALQNEWNRDYIQSDGELTVGAGLVVPGGQSMYVVWVIPPPNPGGTPGTGNGTANVGSCGATPQIIGRGLFVWPTDVHWVSGNPYAPWHMGIDLRAVLGANIYAADTGTIIYAGWSTAGYGNLVVIDHGNGWQTWYGHLSEIWVNCGDIVYQGNVIGLAGTTGRSTGPHLHFETRWQGTLPNPLDVLPPP